MRRLSCVRKSFDWPVAGALSDASHPQRSGPGAFLYLFASASAVMQAKSRAASTSPLNRRAVPRPCLRERGGETPPRRSTGHGQCGVRMWEPYLAERSDRRVRILLTGFGRFPGAPANPSAAIVAAIAHAGRRRLDRCGIELVAAVLPVDFDEIGEELARHLAAAEPDAVLHLGLAGRRPALSGGNAGEEPALAIASRRGKAQARAGDRPRRSAAAPQRAASRRAPRRRDGPGRRSRPGSRTMPAPMSAMRRSIARSARRSRSWASSMCRGRAPHNRPLSRRRAGPARPRLAAMVAAVTAALMLVGAQARRNRRQPLHRGHARSSGRALTGRRAQT